MSELNVQQISDSATVFDMRLVFSTQCFFLFFVHLCLLQYSVAVSPPSAMPHCVFTVVHSMGPIFNARTGPARPVPPIFTPSLAGCENLLGAAHISLQTFRPGPARPSSLVKCG